MARSPLPTVHVYVMGPEWGLPSLSPFGIKLLTWLRVAEVPHVVHVEDDPRKGPKKKSPWIEYDDVRMGDTTLIVQHMRDVFGVDPDAHLTPAQAALGLVIRRSWETHFQAITEYDMFVDDAGWAAMQPHFHFLPFWLRPVALPLIRADSRKEAWIRGIGRHTADERAAIARADLDAASDLLGDQPFFLGDRPTHADCTVYGFLAFVRGTPYPTAARAHVETLPRLVAFHDRMKQRFGTPDVRHEAA